MNQRLFCQRRIHAGKAPVELPLLNLSEFLYVSMHFKLQIQANPKCALTSLCLADTLVRRIDWVGQSAEQAQDLFFTKVVFLLIQRTQPAMTLPKLYTIHHYTLSYRSKIKDQSEIE